MDKNFISGQVLKASELNDIVDEITGLQESIPSLDPEEIEREQIRIQGLIQNAEDKLQNLSNEISNFNIDTINSAIQLLNDARVDADKRLADAEKKLAEHGVKFEQLSDEFNKDMTEAYKQIEDAKKALEEATAKLAALLGDEGDAGVDIMDTIGAIRTFAEWYSVNEGTIIQYQNIMDAMNGLEEEWASYTNTVNGILNTYDQRIDIKNGEIETALTSVNTAVGIVSDYNSRLSAAEGTLATVMTWEDTINGIDTKITSEISAAEGTITTSLKSYTDGQFKEYESTYDARYATKSEVNSYVDAQVESSIKTWSDAKNTEIATLAERIDTTEQTVTGYNARISLVEGTKDEVLSIANTANQTVNTVQTQMNALSADYTITASKVDENSTKIGNLQIASDKINAVVAENGDGNYKISSTAIDTDSIATTVVNTIGGSIKQYADEAKDAAEEAKSYYETAYSTIQQTAQRVGFIASQGQAKYDENGNMTSYTPVNEASVLAQIQETDDDGRSYLNSNIAVKADNILLLGETIANTINAEDLVINGGVSRFNKDGSGYVANGAISWTENGFVGNSTNQNPSNDPSNPNYNIENNTVIINNAGVNVPMFEKSPTFSLGRQAVSQITNKPVFSKNGTLYFYEENNGINLYKLENSTNTSNKQQVLYHKFNESGYTYNVQIVYKNNTYYVIIRGIKQDVYANTTSAKIAIYKSIDGDTFTRVTITNYTNSSLSFSISDNEIYMAQPIGQQLRQFSKILFIDEIDNTVNIIIQCSSNRVVVIQENSGSFKYQGYRTLSEYSSLINECVNLSNTKYIVYRDSVNSLCFYKSIQDFINNSYFYKHEFENNIGFLFKTPNRLVIQSGTKTYANNVTGYYIWSIYNVTSSTIQYKHTEIQNSYDERFMVRNPTCTHYKDGVYVINTTPTSYFVRDKIHIVRDNDITDISATGDDDIILLSYNYEESKNELFMFYKHNNAYYANKYNPEFYSINDLIYDSLS